MKALSPKWRQTAISAATGLAVGSAVTLLSSSISIALAFAAMALVITFTFLFSAAKRRETKFELLWPDVVDHLITGIQSGMSLVEALSQLAERGPRELAPYFAEFNRQVRKDGDFTAAITWLQNQFSHYASDQIFEAIILSRSLGGTHLLQILRMVGDFIRQDLALRKEIEVKHGWIKNSAHLSAAAPWLLLLLLSTQPATAAAYATSTGVVILIAGIFMTAIAYLWMNKLGALPKPPRVFRSDSMNALFLSSALAVMAAYLIVASEQGDEARAFKLSRVKYRKFAANIDDRSKLRDRLLELNRTGQHEYLEFRSSQIATAFLAFVVFALLIWAKSASFAGALVMGVIAGYFAFAFIDRNLTKAVVKRRTQMDAEFPALIEMLTLSISAGQTPLNAMATIAARSECELATEFAVVTKDVIAGAPFHIALDAMGRRIKSVTIRRFIDAMITAMLRGAPIVEVLQRHAQESRTAHRNQIMAAAGKAEISMMIPVVFLILPVSMLFALWPSLSNLNGFM